VIREAIAAAVRAHGAGKILASEMPIEPRTDHKFIRNAPNYGTGPESGPVNHPYTVEALACFLGFVKAERQTPTNSFIAAFGAEELIADGVLNEFVSSGSAVPLLVPQGYPDRLRVGCDDFTEKSVARPATSLRALVDDRQPVARDAQHDRLRTLFGMTGAQRVLRTLGMVRRIDSTATSTTAITGMWVTWAHDSLL